MKLKKSMFGLFLSLAFMLSLNNFQKTSEAQIGWGISALFDSSDNATATNVTGGAAGGATIAVAVWAGTEAGAKIGMVGGLVGVAVGAVVGGL